MAEFKVPDSMPQDLLLIQEMVGILELPKQDPTTKMAEDESSSSSESDISSSDGEDEKEQAADSEDEIEAKLVDVGEEDSDPSGEKSPPAPSHSNSESSSDSEDDEPKKGDTDAAVDLVDVDDEEEGAPSAGAGGVLQTKHEVLEVDIAIPDVDTVDPSEQLEKVGEVTTVMDNVAIVRALPSDNMNRGSQNALDSDTLLVFDDRTVMGYIYETFGPTNQPLYQVKYNSKYPLDRERVKTSREVFVVPSKSKFVFVDRIKAFKGSDASNVYDEEPADDELEFSDDEAEAAYKSRMKRKRGEARARSVAHSREVTPNPSNLRDYELVDDVVLSRNAYDENGPYDLDFSDPGPSRPAPIAYDDPYSMPAETTPVESQSAPPSRPIRPLPRHDAKPRGRGRGGGGFSQNNRGRGRGGGGYDGRRGGAGYSGPSQQAEQSQGDSYSPRTSSQVQGQNYYQQDYSSVSQQPMQPPAGPSWGYPPAGAGGVMQPPFGGQGTGMPFVQPHINPLFASALGFQMSQAQSMGYNPQFNMPPYSGGYQEPHQQQFQQPQQPWSGQWPAPGNVQHPPGGQGQG